MRNMINDISSNKRDVIAQKWKNELSTLKNLCISSKITPDMFEQLNEEFLDMMIRYINQNDIEKDQTLHRFFDKVLQLNMPLKFLTQGLQTFRRVILDVLLQEDVKKEKAIDIYQHVDRLIDPLLNEVVEESSLFWEKTVSAQKTALMELSAPVIPVLENITVMPLIGTIDTERAKLIMENLLDGVIKNRSLVVLIDITGVPVVDTMVAHHIIQAADAVRLLGATCILVGIRPEIAQTIISLGIDLSYFPTKSTLLKGIEHALEITNQQLLKK
ncbi:STAS domain-containing protein [Fictibacillus gelatini]|uniref:STAS domain-containing protein n=1 Tax=Fictibacillus gelatini TaxID=225985 RepID=UPI000404C15E|nr:STAS domain-containing protein [Fictibacillus gelatini]